MVSNMWKGLFPDDKTIVEMQIKLISIKRQPIALSDDHFSKTTLVARFYTVQLPQEPKHDAQRCSRIRNESHHTNTAAAKRVVLKFYLAQFEKIFVRVDVIPKMTAFWSLDLFHDVDVGK